MSGAVTLAAGPAEAVAAQARARPDAPALWWRGETVAFAELQERARHHGDRIRELGIAGGRPVGLRAGKDPESVALVLGALGVGRPFVLPPTTLPGAVLGSLFARAGCAAVLSPTGVERAGPPSLTSTGSPVPAGSSFVLTTSGSTGAPKLVPLPDAGVAAFLAWAGHRFGLGPRARVLSYAPLSFDLSLLDVWAALAHGATSVLVDVRDALRAPRLAATVSGGAVTVVQGLPMLFELLASRHARFETVEHAVLTGDVTAPERVPALAAALPRARLYNLYGATETNDSLLAELDPSRDPAMPLPLGRPLPGVSASLVGPDGRVVEGAGEGELWVRTPFQSGGYLDGGDPGRFRPHPADPEGPTWYRSADLVRRDARGELTLVGRVDARVKVRGVGVDLGAVERALATHPAVEEAAVSPEADAVQGARLVAVARCAPGRAPSVLELRGHVAAQLPAVAVPDDLRVVDHALPRNAHGKVDRARATRPVPRPEPTEGD